MYWIPTMCQALFWVPETVHKLQSSWPYRTYILLDSQAISKEQKKKYVCKIGKLQLLWKEVKWNKCKDSDDDDISEGGQRSLFIAETWMV